MTRKFSFLVSCLLILNLIIPPTLTMGVNAEKYNAEEIKTVYHETFKDGQGLVKQSGNPNLEIVTDKLFDGNDDGAALYVSNRLNDWDAVDLIYSDLKLEDGKTYTLTALIYVDQDEEVPSDAQIEFQAAGDGAWGTPSSQKPIAGESVVLNGEFTVDMNTYDRVRIKTNEAGKEVPFYIGEILITEEVAVEDPGNGDGNQGEIPDGEGIAAFTDFEDETSQGWVARSGHEELTVTNNDAKNGDYSLLVENRQSSSDAAIIDLFENVYREHEYNISLWVKLAEGEEDTPLQLSAAETVNGETSYYPPVIEPTMVTDGDWVLLEGTYNVPKGIEALSFYVEEEYDEDSTSGVSYYIDDFKVEIFVPENPIQDITPLKEIYKDFYIGNAVEPVHFNGRTLELLTKHHNLVTAENIMKPENYYSNGVFDSTGPDRFLRHAVDHGLKIHGHVLLWHAQSEDSLYQNPDGSPKSREEALANMHEHIENVMRSAHAIAGDSIISWDVVNEALDGDWSNPEDWESILRPASGWLQAIGPDYMYEAFLKARQVADELDQRDMKLYYNDYNDHVQSKAQTIYHMVKDINERYADEFPDDDRKLISGVGMQGHYSTSVNIDNVRTSLERFISLGVEVGVTELDVGASEEDFVLTEEEEQQQAYFYAQLFSLYKEHSEHISRITFWGLSDANSWRSKDSPLIFDRNLQAKLAYDALVDPEKFIEDNQPEEIEPREGNAAYGSPTIDGEIDEIWNKAPVININRFQTAHNGATGQARVLWDKNNVYVLVEVNDNELDKSNSVDHEQDSVEVFIDERNTKATSYGEGHGQYRVNFDNEQSFNPGAISEGFESRTVVNGTNYLVEMRIPIRTIELEAGHTVGFDVQINDAANGSRNSIAIWNDDYSGMGWSDPSVFGNLTLLEADGEDPADPTDPADPADPADPTDPTDPTDPADPTDPTDPSIDPGEDSDQEKPTVDDDQKSEEDGDKLPKTATNIFNWVALGLLMVLMGATYLFISRRKRA